METWTRSSDTSLLQNCETRLVSVCSERLKGLRNYKYLQLSALRVVWVEKRLADWHTADASEEGKPVEK